MRKLRPAFKPVVAAIALSFACGGIVYADPARVDRLFEDLRQADPEETTRIVNDIRTEWSKSGSPAMDLLLRRGSDAMESGDYQAAVEQLTALIDHAPDFAEGYHARATAYFNLGLYGPALDDLRQTLVLNPRHFGALQGFAVILEDLGRPEDALELYHRVADIAPHLDGVDEAISRLTLEQAGQAL